MKLDWVRWQKIEKLAADGDTDAKAIVKDCTWMCKKAVRLLHILKKWVGCCEQRCAAVFESVFFVFATRL